MIVSHRYRFIFIKTHKVAGTSIEFALTRFAGEDGIVTPFTIAQDDEEREQAGHGGARNYRAGEREYRNHMPAAEVRELLGRERFDGYFKFSVERNSYDKAVSMYAWMVRNPRRARDSKIRFDEFVRWGGARGAADFDRYAIDGKPAMDFMVMFENLQGGLDAVAERLGLPERIDVSRIRRKSGHRALPDYRDYYSARSRKAVETDFAREIAHFAFTF